MKVDIGISAKNLKSVHQLLNSVLADGNVFYIKLRKFHWNLSGGDFLELHELFEVQYKALELAIDQVAERISTLGGVAIGTMKEFVASSQLKETPGKIPNSQDMLKELVKDHETIIKSLRKMIDTTDSELKDAGTADFLTGLMSNHEKMAWKLRQYLKP